MAAATKIEITAVDKTQRAFDSVQSSLQKMTGALTSAKAAVGGLVASFAVNQFTGFLDAATRIENRLKLVTKSSTELATAQASVLRIAQATGSGLEDTADLYQRIAANAETLKLAQSDVATITDTVAKSIKISGSTASSAQGAITQLGQALASGALRGEEFNSVNEQAPRIMKALAAALGVPRGELKKLAGEGKLTSEIVVKALLEQSKVISEEYGNTSRTVEDTFTKLKNTVIVLSGELDDQLGVTDLLVDALNGLASTLADLPQLFRDANDELVGLSAGLLTIAAPSIYATISAGLIAIAGGIKAITLAMINNPIGLLVAGLTSLAAYFISSNWEAVSGGLDDMQAKISGLSDEARAAEITRLSSKLEELQSALEMQQLAERSALGDAGKRARQENIQNIQQQITKTKELINLYKTAGTGGATTPAGAPVATPTATLSKKPIFELTQEQQKLFASTLDLQFAQARQAEQARFQAEANRILADGFESQGMVIQRALNAQNGLQVATFELTQEQQDLYTSQLDNAFAAHTHEQAQLDLAKAIFLTNMEQGKYTDEQAFQLASQLGLMTEMVALQKLNADRAFAASQATKELTDAQKQSLLQLEQLSTSMLPEGEQQMEAFKRQLEERNRLVQNALDQEVISTEEASRLKLRNEEAYSTAVLDLQTQQAASLASITTGLMKTLADENRQMFDLYKASAIVEAMVNAQVAATKALAQLGVFGPAAAGVIYAAAMARVYQIEKMQPPKREFGGPVKDGQPYLVGERGPEMFVPNGSGSIVPNNELGGVTNVNFTINAVDATGVDQLLMARRGMIVSMINQAMNQRARRGIV